MMKAFGRSSPRARKNWGIPLRGSSAANRLPPMENGWHGGPPATRAKDPRIALKSTVEMSASKTFASGCVRPVGRAGVGDRLDCGRRDETGSLETKRQASGAGEEVDGFEGA